MRMGRYDDGFDKGTVRPQAYDRYRQAGGAGALVTMRQARNVRGFPSSIWSSWAALSCARGAEEHSRRERRILSGQARRSDPHRRRAARYGGFLMPVACVDDEANAILRQLRGARLLAGDGQCHQRLYRPHHACRCAGRQRGGIADSRGCDPSSETGAGKRDGLQLASCSPSFSFDHVLWLCVREKPWLGCRARISLHEGA